MLRAVLLLLLIAPFGRSQDPAPPDVGVFTPPAPNPPGRGRITGHILCNDTRRPARGAMVMVTALPSPDGKVANNAQESMSRTAMDGSYTADHLPPGEYAVIALYPGYLSSVDDFIADMSRDPKKMRELLARNGSVVLHGAEQASFDVTLERGAAISGRVLFSDGSPAAQVTIALEDVNAKPPKPDSPEANLDAGALMRTMFTHQSSGTDDQGRFRIAGLKSGTYRISAVESAGGLGDNAEDGMAMMFAGIADPSAMHFYSGDTLHKSKARTYDLRPGDEIADINITIPENAFHQVRGTLTSLGGRGVTQARLSLKDAADEDLAFGAQLATDGRFLFPAVPAGTYTLSVTGAQFVDPQAQNPPTPYIPGKPYNPPAPPPPVLYQDQTVAVIVKDSDVVDLAVTLKEAAARNASTQPAPQ